MKILVTGGNGFLGKHVCQKLKTDGHEVIAPKRTDYDLVLPHHVEEMFSELEPEIVIHLAAVVGGIGANMLHPGKFMYENLMMGVNIVDAAFTFDTQNTVLVSTVCSYPKYAKVPFKEEEIWNGYPEETNAPYGIAKKTVAELLKAYNREYGVHGCVLVPVNLYGEGDNFDDNTSHVIPSIIKKVYNAVLNNEPYITLWGSGSATREFLYVKDCAEAISLAINHTNPSPINIGIGKEISIIGLTHKICNILDYKGEIRLDRNKPDGQPRRKLCVEKAKKLLNFEAKVDLDEGLQNTVDWYVKNYGTLL
jgi:GDP-L-fucose synthase